MRNKSVLVPRRFLWAASGLGTFLMLLGCTGGQCGDSFLTYTVYGGGAVAMTLTAGEGGGVSGAGIAAGWDPENAPPGGPDQPGGAYFVSADTPESSYGNASVFLDRTDTLPCEVHLASLSWSPPDYASPSLGITDEIDVDTATRGTQYTLASTFSAPTLASGSLTLDDIVWDNPDCGTSSITFSWAFDEANPVEQYDRHTCM